MRITLLANRDLASLFALNLLVRQAPQHTYTVLLSAKVGGSSSKPAGLQQLSFFEQTLFNQLLFPLIEHQAHTPSCLRTFEQLNQVGIAISDIANINNSQGVQIVASHKPNLILSIRFGQILQQAIIDIPEYGVINLHSGKLPEYRGVMATFWAMYNQQQHITSTLHYIDSSKIDAGSRISCATRDIDFSKSYLSNVLSLYPQGVQQIIGAINFIERGESVPLQPMSLATQAHYYTFPTDEQLLRFNQLGYSLVDYTEILEISRWFTSSCEYLALEG
ncbi:formyl transferase [Aliiglaciecola sp. LCG003]|uniref:formyl transferase n=1 Tax=Aliiglaciecola sp. LCG003 TaxID=3053655 RepID=UPI0025733FD2|nr:formyl transferase [Aliiglaciecola sp. LCG003]WJG07985.1 formyl transferase [Aliiglaciecola sp. LCG003]